MLITLKIGCTCVMASCCMRQTCCHRSRWYKWVEMFQRYLYCSEASPWGNRMKTKEDVRRDNVCSLGFVMWFSSWWKSVYNTGNIETTVFAYLPTGMASSKEQIIIVALSWQNPSSVSISYISFAHQGLLFSKDEAFNDEETLGSLWEIVWGIATPHLLRFWIHVF